MMLGVWLFALFAGAANACGWLEPNAARANVVAVKTDDPSNDADAAIGCEQFCQTDVPVVTKLPPIDDQSATQPLIVAVRDVGVTLVFPPALRLVPAATSPPDVPPYLRLAHLRL